MAESSRRRDCLADRPDSLFSKNIRLPDIEKSAFGPTDIERLATAYESALRILELNDRDDPITEIIARRIFEAAQTGLRDPDSLCARTSEFLNWIRNESPLPSLNFS